jgi:hypothetical protein
MPSDRATVTREWVLAELPQGFAVAVAEGIQEAYAETQQECAGKYGQEAEDLRGHLLRCKVERNLRVRCSALNGANVCFEFNVARNSRHVVVRAGRLIITASAVETRHTIVRHAEFRGSFALSNKLSLFGESEENRTGKPQYLLVLHGAGGADGAPGFIDIVPPTADCDGYLEEARIDLLREVAAAAPTEPITAEVITAAAPELLADVAVEEEQG